MPETIYNRQQPMMHMNYPLGVVQQPKSCSWSTASAEDPDLFELEMFGPLVLVRQHGYIYGDADCA